MRGGDASAQVAMLVRGAFNSNARICALRVVDISAVCCPEWQTYAREVGRLINLKIRLISLNLRKYFQNLDVISEEELVYLEQVSVRRVHNCECKELESSFF